MASEFKILVDRLKSGQVEKIEGFFDPVFFDVNEKELSFPFPVEVQGEAYVSEEHLVLHIKGSTQARMPCAICNEMVHVAIQVPHFYHTEPIEGIKGAVFDFKEQLREAFLTELPKIVECNGSNCPERSSIRPYLKQKKNSENPTYFPFSDLN